MKLPNVLVALWIVVSLIAAGCSQGANEGTKAIAALQARIATCARAKVEHHGQEYEIPISLLQDNVHELSASSRPPRQLGKKFMSPGVGRVSVLQENGEQNEFYLFASGMLVDGDDNETYVCELNSDRLPQAVLNEILKQSAESK